MRQATDSSASALALNWQVSASRAAIFVDYIGTRVISRFVGGFELLTLRDPSIPFQLHNNKKGTQLPVYLLKLFVRHQPIKMSLLFCFCFV